MPNFSKETRVYTDSLIQIADGIDDLVLSLSRGPIRFGAHKLNKARTLNALYLWFLAQPRETQDRIMTETMPTLKRHYDSKDRLAIEPSVPPSVRGKRAAYPINQSIVDSDALSDNEPVSADNGAPQRGRRLR